MNISNQSGYDKLSGLIIGLSCTISKTITTTVRLASSFEKVKFKQLNTNICHYYVPTFDGRPLVLIFGWMMSHRKHLQKYCNLYISRGFDVITIQVRPSQIILPLRTQYVIQTLADYLEEELHKNTDIVVHGFSVGGYVYSELLVKFDEDPERYSELINRIAGQIFDSPVDLDGIPRGFSNILAKNKILKSSLKRTLEVYLNVFENQITKHYHRGSNAFKLNKLKTPSLMLYSKADPVGCPDRIEDIMENWKRYGAYVCCKKWNDSPHVGHFPKYPVEYVDTLLLFLQNCDVLKSDTDISDYKENALFQ